MRNQKIRSFLISLKVSTFSLGLKTITVPPSLDQMHPLLPSLLQMRWVFTPNKEHKICLFVNNLYLTQHIPENRLPLTPAPFAASPRRESTARGKQRCRFGSLELDAFKLQSALCCYLAVCLIVFSVLPGSLPMGAILDLVSLPVPPVPAVLSLPWHIISPPSLSKM